MNDYPAMIARVNQVEPVPRRIRGVLDGHTVIDTIRARYVWEWANYPQYYIPIDDVKEGVLIDEGRIRQSRTGPVHMHGLQVGDVRREGVARVLTDPPTENLKGTVRLTGQARQLARKTSGIRPSPGPTSRDALRYLGRFA